MVAAESNEVGWRGRQPGGGDVVEGLKRSMSMIRSNCGGGRDSGRQGRQRTLRRPETGWPASFLLLWQMQLTREMQKRRDGPGKCDQKLVAQPKN